MSIKVYENGAWRDANTHKIYENGAWRDAQFMKVYENGAWVDKLVHDFSDGWIYNEGQYSSYWDTSFVREDPAINGVTGSVVVESDSIHMIKNTYEYNDLGVKTKNTINIRDYHYLHVIYSATNNTYTGYPCQLNIGISMNNFSGWYQANGNIGYSGPILQGDMSRQHFALELSGTAFNLPANTNLYIYILPRGDSYGASSYNVELHKVYLSSVSDDIRTY
jgi:hypothetical protein